MKFAVEVPVRWSDMDAYGHVNRHPRPARPQVLTIAETTMVPYDVRAERSRRLTVAERDFLAMWTAGA